MSLSDYGFSDWFDVYCVVAETHPHGSRSSTLLYVALSRFRMFVFVRVFYINYLTKRSRTRMKSFTRTRVYSYEKVRNVTYYYCFKRTYLINFVV